LKIIDLRPDWKGGTLPFRKTWQAVGNIDQFRWLSRADVLEHLRMARDELGVRHVRAVAMYSPELSVWNYDLRDWRIKAPEKSKKINWQMVDLSLERLIALGLKPIYTTCFTPAGMTDDATSMCWPDKNPTGMPRDLVQWQEFVADGLRHHVERFGIEEVRSWYFECWNEPNLAPCFFGGTKEDFFQLWSATWRAVKSVDPSFRFGGPSTARGEWIADFLDFAEREGTPPDYIITHVYNNDSESQPLSPFDGPASYKVKDSPHFASGVIRGLRKLLDARGYPGEVHWNEWGRSWFLHDPFKETALEPAFIVKTMAQSSQDADAFAFWCLSDIYNQGGFQSSEFQCNYGMLSLHGLRKQAWMAHQLLNRLGSDRVAVNGGDELFGALATREGDRVQALVYAFPQQHDAAPVKIEVRVAWPSGNGTPALIRRGAEENNIVATWKAMGAPAYPKAAQLAELRAGNTLQPAPSGAVRMEQSPEGRVAVFEMECPGTAMLEIQLKN
jgi:xylan 1,4-beta-xylosidase